MEIIAFIYGVVFGSFSNVLIDRIESGESVLWGRSHCDHCKKTLRWYELIPLLSYCIQQGRCRRCHHHLSIQYPFIELITAVGYVLLLSYIPFGILYVCAAIIFSACVVITMADIKYQIIPDEMVLLATIASGVYVYFMNLNILIHMATALGASAFFYILWFSTKGKGMGFGDVKLAGFLGLFLGYPAIFFALYSAFLTGAVVGVILILRSSKTFKSKIAFGPFLIFGFIIAIVLKQPLLHVWNIYF